MRYIISIIATLLFCLPQPAWSEKEAIVWYHADYPPGSIGSGPLKGTGYHDLFLQNLSNSLPEYSHSYRIANYSRIIKQLQTSNSCCIALYKNAEREKFIQFSQPTIIGLSNGVLVLSKDFHKFKPFINADGRISICKLFNNSDLRLGISKGRRYTGAIDKLIQKNKDSDKIYIYYKKDVFEGLIKLLEAERNIDYTIGHPQEIAWLTRQGIVEDKFKFIPIKEITPYSIAYIGCTKNKWGKKVISRINQILEGNYDSEYVNAHQNFLPPEGVKLHRKYLQEVFPIRDASDHK
ncbi:TIGR02285 family protein [Maridesulfovibrio sp.]|uniref:TIGR02285 family protein n=1 Tax=Maridesulfovibrio sp. TaxID=2795000 RepID=UPI003BAC0D7A